MLMKKMVWIPLLITAMALIGCASRQSSQYYQRAEAQKMQTVLLGEIVAIDNVIIEGTKTPAGTVVGAIIGGIFGSMVGGGKGQNLATAVGASAGALGGSAAEEELTKKPGYGLTITLDDGETVSIVQEADVHFSVGERVRIIKNSKGTARVTPL